MHAAQAADDDVIYHGLSREDGGAVIFVENACGEQIGVVPHLPKHSPSGLNWGFAGSGPADTARSLLIAALGPNAICPACNGTNRVIYIGETEDGAPVPEPFDADRHRWTPNGWQCECDGGYKRLPYPAFTERFVSQWDAEWIMTQASILTWLSAAQDL